MVLMIFVIMTSIVLKLIRGTLVNIKAGSRKINRN